MSFGIGVPPPAQLGSPSNPPGSETRGHETVVIQSVDDPNNPKYATVSVRDKFPFEANYSIPIGMGPWTVGGINTTSTTSVAVGSVVVTPASMTGLAVGHQVMCANSDNSNPELVKITAVTSTTFTATFTSTKTGTWNITSNAFTYNNSTGVGGSIFTADLDARVLIAGPLGVNNVPATPYYSAIGDHKHDGNLNPGGYTNPDPIDTGQMLPMPTGATFTASNISASIVDSRIHILINGIGNWSPALWVTWTLGDTNNPNSTLWGAAWVPYIRQHSTANATDKSTYIRQTPSSVKGISLGNGSIQNILVGTVNVGLAYDVGFALMDHTGRETPLVQFFSNYSVEADLAPTSNLIPDTDFRWVNDWLYGNVVWTDLTWPDLLWNGF